MLVEYLGHSCFYFMCSDPMVELVTDPYETGDLVKYAPVNKTANVVTVSHQHKDHNNIAGIADKVLDRVQRVDIGGVEFKAIQTFHDNVQGKERGANIIWMWEMEGVRCAHLGDLGHLLSDNEAKQIKGYEMVFAPMGGGPTLEPKDMIEMLEKLKVKVVVPMHYRTEKCTYPKYGLDDLLKLRPNAKKLNKTKEIIMGGGLLPRDTEIWIFNPAR